MASIPRSLYGNEASVWFPDGSCAGWVYTREFDGGEGLGSVMASRFRGGPDSRTFATMTAAYEWLADDEPGDVAAPAPPPVAKPPRTRKAAVPA